MDSESLRYINTMLDPCNSSDKKLWKLIGLEQQLPSQFINDSECSTVKLPDRYIPDSHSNSIDQVRLFSSQPFDHKFKNRLTENLATYSKQEQLPSQLDVESCESREDDAIPEPARNSCIPSTLKNIKGPLRQLQNSCRVLKEENKLIKKEVQDKVEYFKWLLLKYCQQAEVFIENSRQKQLVCHKCENNKKIAQVLTKQCWQLETQVNIKDLSITRLSQQLAQVQDNPLKEIEQGLYEERAEMIKNIKVQLELLGEQNISLRASLDQAQIKLEESQSSYKQSLSGLKMQIEQIQKAAEYRIQKLLEQKKNVEFRLEGVSKQYESLLEERSRKSAQDIRSNLEDMNSSLKLPSSKIRRNKKKYEIIGSSMKDIEYNQPCDTSSRERRRFDTQICQDVSQGSLAYESRSYKTCFSDLSMLGDVHKRQQSALIRNRIKVAHVYHREEPQYLNSSYGNAFDSLASLRREVRRQIKRSNCI